MALLPDARVGDMTPAEIIARCQRLTFAIGRNVERARAQPSYQAWAHVYRLRKERRQLQARIRPRLATVDGEAVNQ